MKNKNIEKKKNSKIGFIHLKSVNVFSREFIQFILTSLTNKNNSLYFFERRKIL